MAHNWQKWKGIFPAWLCHKTYRVESVCRKLSIILENYGCYEYVQFRAECTHGEKELPVNHKWFFEGPTWEKHRSNAFTC